MTAKIGILGINSFSGSTFAKHLLDKGYSVLGFARSTNLEEEFLPHMRVNVNENQLEVVKANHINDFKLMAELILDHRIELIVNFASQSMVSESWNHPEDWYDTNISALAKLINLLNVSGGPEIKKFIQFSTPEVYGSTSGLIKENWNFNPTTPYAISRAASDLHLRAMFNTHGFPVIFTRTANIYGPYQRLYRLIPKVIITALKGDSFKLQGAGKSIRSFIHSSDVSEALERLLSFGIPGESYHISGQNFISILDLTKKILMLLGVDFESSIRIVDDRPGKDFAYLLDSSKIRFELQWSDQVSLDEGLQGVITWVKEQFDTFQNMSLDYIHRR